MSRRDFIHVAVRAALENDGWKVTDDPLLISLEFEKFNFQIDLGIENLINALKNTEKIAIEVKSFDALSLISSFHTALGQYLNYKDALEMGNYPHSLHLGVSELGYERLMNSRFIRMQLIRYEIKIVIVDLVHKKVTKWIDMKNIKML